VCCSPPPLWACSMHTRGTWRLDWTFPGDVQWDHARRDAWALVPGGKRIALGLWLGKQYEGERKWRWLAGNIAGLWKTLNAHNRIFRVSADFCQWNWAVREVEGGRVNPASSTIQWSRAKVIYPYTVVLNRPGVQGFLSSDQTSRMHEEVIGTHEQFLR
jgi:hypothetical protein